MKPTPIINRRGWLATWLQKRRRGRQHKLLPAPVLVAQYPAQVVWTWDYANPYRWNAYLSLNNGLTWQFDDWKWGDARMYAPDGGSSPILIVGVDESGNEITERSNAVRADDAPEPPAVPPAPVVTLFEVIDNNGMIDVTVAWSWDGQGWPDDGVFLITIDADDDASGGVLFLVNAIVAGPGRTCSMSSIGVAEDKGYYCRVKYKKDTDVSADSATVYGNPY